MSGFDSLLTQALQLPEEERWKLVTQLLGSLELDGGHELTDAEWAPRSIAGRASSKRAAPS